MIAFYWYVLCIGILLSWHANDVMFLGSQANFGTQKNYATGTFRTLFRLNRSHKKCRKTIADMLTSDDRKEVDLHLQRGSIARGVFRDILRACNF